jgi:hypothetical protein
MSTLTPEQQRLAAAVNQAVEVTGWRPADVLHELSDAPDVDRAAVARVLCPDAESDFNGTAGRRLAARAHYAEHIRPRLAAAMLDRAARLDPADRSEAAEILRAEADLIRVEQMEQAEQGRAAHALREDAYTVALWQQLTAEADAADLADDQNTVTTRQAEADQIWDRTADGRRIAQTMRDQRADTVRQQQRDDTDEF